MLSEIYPGGSPNDGSTYWDQILEVGVISVSRRLLKRLQEFLEQVRAQILFIRLLFQKTSSILLHAKINFLYDFEH